MTEKEYCVKREGVREWEQISMAFSPRKAAICFAETCEGLKASDVLLVVESGKEGEDPLKFVTSDLVSRKEWQAVAIDSTPVEITEKHTEIRDVKRIFTKSDLRANSSYEPLRIAVKILAALSTLLVLLTMLSGIDMATALDSGVVASTTFLMCAVQGIAIYASLEFVLAIIDIADASLRRLEGK